ncbi:MAG: DUF4157 domain-containing protein [Bacteroidia bacterium]
MSAPEKVNPQKGPQRQPPQREQKHAPGPGREDGSYQVVDNPLIGHGAMSAEEAKADGKGLWLKRDGEAPAYRNPFMVQMHGDKPITLPRKEGFPKTVSRPNWMTQAKPKIGQPGDKFEQEADQVAEAVVSNKGKQMSPAPPAAPPSDGGPGTPPVQNQEFSGIQQKAEGEEVQKMEIPGIQQKSEGEEVQKMEIPGIQQKSEGEEVQKMEIPGIQQKSEGEEVQKMEIPGIQQKAEGEEVQKMEIPGIQQKAEGEEVQKKENGPAEAPDGLGERLASSKGGGEPLAPDTKEHMEGAIGADFSGVRVHKGDEAKGMSQDLNAQAFTHGNDIYFNEGKYNPGTTEGDRLLAHELTHTVQQGAAPAGKAQRKPKENAESGKIQRIVEKPKTPAAPAGGAPTAAPVQPLDISKGFDPTPEIEALFADANLNKPIDVPVRIGKLVAGTIKVRQTSRPKGTVKGKYSIEANQGIAYDGLGFFNGIKSMGITPVIAVAKGPVAPGQPIGMYYGFQVGKTVSGNPKAFMEQMKKATEALGMVGFKLPTTNASITNAVEGDTLNFSVTGLKVNVAGYVDGEAEFGQQGENFTFKAGMTVDVKGLAQGRFSIERDKEGKLAGEGEIETQIANLSGKVGVKYLGTGDIQVKGSVGIQSEKFSGSVSLMVADKVTADKMMKAELGLPEVEEQGKKKPDAKAPETKTKANQAVAIWGEVEAKITPWLTGRAKVGISSEGHVTVIGKIAPPSDVVLMEQNTKKIDLFKVEAKGGYGIPFIGQVGFFVSLGMFIKAGFGPLTLRNIAFEGTYSTDPSVMQNFKITGALNISAFAMIALEVEAGLFLTILGHDIKAGINLTAGAGIKAYAEVQPTFEYQEKAGPGGKVGEAWLRGHFEAAAQLFLKLSGEFFVELDSPWWSPAPDKRWPYPLFDVEYPLGKSMGIGGDVDWLVGSPELPELKFSPVEFDPDKFTSDIMADPPPKAGGGKGGEQNPQGKFDMAGGDKKDEKPETKDGPGLKGKKEPAEDVSKMTNDQKFIRACEKIGKIGDDAKSKPLALMQLQEKVKKIQSTYGIQSIKIADKDGEAKVTVKHPGKDKQNTNEKEPIKVKLMTVAEMMKLAEAGKKDLEGKVKAKEDPKAHTMKEADAKAIAEEVKAAHYVFEDVTVAQKGDRWEYVLNLAGKTMAVPGSGVEKEKAANGKPGDGELGKTQEFEAKGDKHKLWIKPGPDGGKLWVASDPQTVDAKLKLWEADLKLPKWNDGRKKEKKTRIAVLINRAKAELTKIDNAARESVKAADATLYAKIDKDIEVEQKSLADILKQLFQEFGEGESIDFKVVFVEELQSVHPEAKATIIETVDKITAKNTLDKKGLAEFNSYSGLQKKVAETPEAQLLFDNPFKNGKPLETYLAKLVEDAGKEVQEDNFDSNAVKEAMGDLASEKGSRPFTAAKEMIWDKTKEALVLQRLKTYLGSKGSGAKSADQVFKEKKITEDGKKKIQAEVSSTVTTLNANKNASTQWVAVFPALGRSLKIETRDGDRVAKFSDIIPKDQIFLMVIEAIKTTIERDPAGGTAISKDPKIEKEIEKISTKIANHTAKRPLFTVTPTEIPRNLKGASSSELVQVNSHSISPSLYSQIAENHNQEINVKFDGEIHHIVPLYLGGGHNLYNLLAAQGSARLPDNVAITTSVHAILHDRIDKAKIAAFLQDSLADAKISANFEALSPSDITNMMKGKQNLIIGTLFRNGDIKYRDAKISLDDLKK